MNIHNGDNITTYGQYSVGKVVGHPEPMSVLRGMAAHPPNVVWGEPFVFVNYRNADTKAAADLEVALTRRLGRGAVFRDAGMRAGVDFPRELTEKASTCKVMLVVIGIRWDDAEGLRLLHDPADWVRREIATALAHHAQVVPILVGARGKLTADDLPEDIRAIAYRQAPHLRRNYDEVDVGRLVDELVRDLPALSAAVSRTTGG